MEKDAQKKAQQQKETAHSEVNVPIQLSLEWEMVLNNSLWKKAFIVFQFEIRSADESN